MVVGKMVNRGSFFSWKINNFEAEMLLFRPFSDCRKFCQEYLNFIDIFRLGLGYKRGVRPSVLYSCQAVTIRFIIQCL